MINFLRNNAKVVAITILVFFVATMGSGTFFLSKYGKSDTEQTASSGTAFATIGSIPIDQTKFREMIQFSMAQLGAQKNRSIPPEFIENLQMQALQEAARYSVFVHAAEAQKISVTRAERNQAIDAIIKQYGFKDKRELKKKLKEAKYPYNSFIGRLENDIKVQKLINQVKEQITITDRDVENKYTEINARHILIAIDPKTSAEDAEKKSQSVFAEIKGGLSFEDAAKKYSADPSNKDKGGELGWFGAGRMVTTFEDAAFALEKGELSTPVRTEFGYHIIQVADRREIARPASTDLETEKKQLLAERQDRKLREMLGEAGGNQPITVNDPELNATYQKFRGNIQGALAGYQLMISKNPSATYGHYLMANTYFMTGEIEKAIQQLEIADIKGSSSPQFDSPYIHLFLGRMYDKNGRPRDAQLQFDKATALGSQDLTILTQLKSIYTQNNNLAKQLEVEAAMLKLQPSEPTKNAAPDPDGH